ncbi:Ceramide synthase [Ameca splendens]|uniref:Ceramide synthase n=1 Tax=Ameca splendens TaxID=208324 RepID=A0ABV1AFD9_9TELE
MSPPHPILPPSLSVPRGSGQLWRQGKGDYFQGILFLAELSTPSVCLGKVLIQYQKQNSVLHKVNGVFMLLSFFSCRVLLFPYLYYAYSRYASIPLYWVPLVAPWQCNLGAALLWPLQLYWFALICRGALRQSGRRLKATGSTDSSTRKLMGGR